MKIYRSLILMVSLALSSSGFAAGKLSQVFTADTMGATVPYLEQMTGPARTTFSLGRVTFNSYKVEGCDVSVRIINGTVQSIGIEKLSSKCTFNLNRFLPNLGQGRLPSPHNMTFGQFAAFAQHLRFTSDCLTNCGNAADPSVYGTYEAPRADGFFELRLGVVLVAGPALEASTVWMDAMTRSEGHEWLDRRKFNCSDKYDPVARKAFRNVRVTSAVIGFGLAEDDCRR